MPEAISITMAINRYFGRKVGQGLIEFSKEIKALTHKDREELAEMLSRELDVIITIK